MRDEIEDACQEFFVDCFQQGGALERAEEGRQAGFRAFLYGIARNIALRYEERVAKRHARNPGEIDLRNLQADETQLSQVFDRAWAHAVLREAGQRHIENAEQMDHRARRRVELLRLRFQEGLSIREIAGRWQVEAAELHREYAKARQEFEQSLHEVIAFHHPGFSAKEIQRECAGLLTLFK